MLLGGPQVLGRVYRPQHRIVGGKLVKAVYEAPEGLFPADGFEERRGSTARSASGEFGVALSGPADSAG